MSNQNRDEEREPTVDPDPDTDFDGTDRSPPPADLAEGVEGATDADRSRSSDLDDPFDRREAAEIDGERLWERLEAEDTGDAPVSDDRNVREVEKRSYCQGCDHFSEPPAVACDHETAEILSVPTTATFRVAGCPFALDDESVEREY